MAQELAFAAPTTEEMTRVAVVGVGAGFTGAVEGVIVAMAPKLGALEPIATWGSLLGVPAVGALGALMTKGILSDLAMGIAAGGAAILGYTMPAMLQEFTGAKPQALPPANVKQLTAGPLGAPARAQAAASIQRAGNPGARQLAAGNPGTRQLPANAGYIPVITDEAILV